MMIFAMIWLLACGECEIPDWLVVVVDEEVSTPDERVLDEITLVE